MRRRGTRAEEARKSGVVDELDEEGGVDTVDGAEIGLEPCDRPIETIARTVEVDRDRSERGEVLRALCVTPVVRGDRVGSVGSSVSVHLWRERQSVRYIRAGAEEGEAANVIRLRTLRRGLGIGDVINRRGIGVGRSR